MVAAVIGGGQFAVAGLSWPWLRGVAALSRSAGSWEVISVPGEQLRVLRSHFTWLGDRADCILRNDARRLLLRMPVLRT
jgi:hypothetical protein